MSEMIGRLRVALGLETASFERGAKRAAAEINTFGSATEKAGLKVGGMAKAVIAGGAAIAGLAVVDKLKDMVKTGLDYASSLGETAKQLGVTTKALQEYRYAASQTGVKEEEMDQALARLTRTIGEAERGNKKAKAAFENLGISIRDSNGHVKDAGALIPEIAGALEKVGSPAQQATTLVDLFGKSGQKLGPLMAEGARGVNSLRDAANSMGLVLTDEMINNADAAADNMETLNRVLSMQINTAVAANAKEIAAFTQTLTNFAIEAIKAFNAWNQFNGALDKRANAKEIFNDKIEKKAKEKGWTPQQVEKAKQIGSDVLDRHYGVAPVSQGKGWTASNNPLWTLKTVTPKTNFAPTAGPLGNGAIGVMAGMQPGEGKSWADIVWDQNDRWAAVRGELADDTRKTAEVIDESSLDIEAANERVSRSFEDMANNSLNALQSLVNAVQSGDVVGILQTVLGLGQALGVNFGGGGYGSAASINTGTLDILRGTPFNPNLPAYANGTNFHPGGLALVGERGPEIVRLPRGAGVTPNHALGGGVVHNYFQGNLMTPEFWQRISQQDAQAAMAGGELGYRKVVTKARRRLA